MRRAIIKISINLFILGGILFGSAGQLDWVMAWLYLIIHILSVIVVFLLGDPKMIHARGYKEKNVKKWDVVLATFSFLLYSPVSFFIADLDYGRFHWTPPLHISVKFVAFLVFVFGISLATWAMVANQFFSKFLKVQKERNHCVITKGPYAYIRYPGYAGGSLTFLALPVTFGSLWALIPATLGVYLMIIRTFF